MKKGKRKALSLMLAVSLLLGMTPDVPAMAARVAESLAGCIEKIVVTHSTLMEGDAYVLSSDSTATTDFTVTLTIASGSEATWSNADPAAKASISNAISSDVTVATVASISNADFDNDTDGTEFLLKVKLAENALPGTTATIKVTVGNRSKDIKVIAPGKSTEPTAPTITITSENNKTEVEMGKTLQLTGTVEPAVEDYDMVWSSSEAIATVDQNGLVTAVEEGNAVITYSDISSSAKATLTITVISATPEDSEVLVESINMYHDGESNSMGIDESRQIYAYTLPYTATNRALSFTSSDESIAAVAPSGEYYDSAVVTGLKAGKVTITAAATDGSGVTSNMEFEVLDIDKVTKITINGGKKIRIRLDDKDHFIRVTTEPENAAGLVQEWSSSNPDIFKVSQGWILGRGVGTATLSVTIKGVTATCEVEVWAQELDLALSRTKVTLQEGNETRINALITKPDLGGYGSTEWKSSNPEVLEITEGVDLWANVSAKSAGTAVLTATLDGKEATCEFTVTKDVVVPTPADKMDAVLEENRDKLETGTDAEKETAVKNIFDAVQDTMKDVKVDSMSDDDMTAIINLEEIILNAIVGKFNPTDWAPDADVALSINEIKGAVLNLPTDWPSGIPVSAKMTIANANAADFKTPANAIGAQAFDINLAAVAGERTKNLTDLKVPVEINMEIPDELLNANNLWVYNYHSTGIIKIKPTIHGDGTMTIRVNKFSPFVLMDIPTSGGGSSSSSGSSNSSVRDNGLRGQWVQDSTGWWFKNTTGGYPKNQWAQINTKWYHFDNVGYMQTGWILLNNSWYYLKPQGDMASKEWVDHNGKRYYLHDNGTMMSNQWFSYNNSWYYMGTDGAMLTNATTPDGHKVDAAGIWVK